MSFGVRSLIASGVLLWAFVAGLYGQKGDGCHVYVIDYAAAEKAGPEGCLKDKDESKCGVTIFPEFKPEIGEEISTTKTYPFPKLKFIITAKILFTDEMLSSAKGSDSLMMSISVAPRELRDEFSDENSAVAEFSLADMADAMRVKRIFRLQGKRYFVGLECHFKALPIE